MEPRSVFYRDEGDLLKGSGCNGRYHKGALELLDECDEAVALEALRILGCPGGPDVVRSGLEGGGILRTMLPKGAVERMEENLFFGEHPREGPLGPLIESASESLLDWDKEILTSALRDAAGVSEGMLASLEDCLASQSDSDAFGRLFELFGEGRGSIVISLSGSPEAVKVTESLSQEGAVPVLCFNPDDYAASFTPSDPWVLDGLGEAFRFLASLIRVFDGFDVPAWAVVERLDEAAALSAMGIKVMVVGDHPEGLERSLLEGCATDILGAPVVFQDDDGLKDEPTLQGLIDQALIGAKVVSAIAILRLAGAEEGDLQYPETGYGLPCFTAWRGEKEIDVVKGKDLIEAMASGIPSTGGIEDALEAGETAMYACELLEALRYRDHPELVSQEGVGFVPDRVLRELGLSFVDDSIPGCALLMGRAPDHDHLRTLVRECQNRGLVIMVADDAAVQLDESGLRSSWGRMLYPLSKQTAIIHAINFALRAALSFGNIAPGDRDRLSSYLEKRPKVVIIHMGPLDPVRSALAFAAIMHKAVIVTDIPVPEVPDLLERRTEPLSMLQKGMEMRDIVVQSRGVDVPVPYGPAFEGEVIRKEDMRVEMGGGRSTSFELLITRDEDAVHDGEVVLVGEDIDGLPPGSVIPFAIIIEVYGKNMEPDFEAVLERRVHQFLNYGEGVWHSGQRDMDWLRISNDAYESGFRVRHIGEILIDRLKNEFGGIVSRIQVTLVTEGGEVERRLEEAREVYAQREARMSGLKDDSVEVFYTCTLCQSFAPDHVCIISPERLGLCGAINWLDAKASNRIAAHGPNQPIDKGREVDSLKGEWEGLNETVIALSNRKVERVCMYSLMDAPMTSCGCFEAIVAMSSDMQGVVIVDREYTGMTPVGMRFSTLAGSIGGGRQTPGFMGIGRKYITSDKFLAAEGGLARVAWMPRGLKERLAAEITEAGIAMGIPDLLDRIADETVCEDAAGLFEWMQKVDHPALGMPPML